MHRELNDISFANDQKSGNFEPLLHSIKQVVHIYVVKPEGYKEKLLTGSALSSSKFLITVVTKDVLFKYISTDELTEEFGGTRKHDHTTWYVVYALPYFSDE